MAKPRVRIKGLAPLVVGEASELTVEVTTEDALRVESIDLVLEGRQGWSIGHGKSRVESDAVFPQIKVRLMGAGELAAGTTTPFDVSFTLRRGTAPSHAVSPAYAAFRARVHVSIPWRIDGRYAFELPVRLPPPAQVERTPVIARSPVGHEGDDPRLEVSLASSRLVAGEVVVGSVALFHLDERRHCKVAFVPVLRLYGRGRPRERRGAPIRARVELPADHGGRSIPFRIQLPADMTPTFESVSHALAWQLEVSSDSLFGRSVTVRHPLQVVDAAARASSPTLAEAPRLADEWIETLFTVVAARAGWRVLPAEQTDGVATLVGELAHGRARIHHAYRDDGTFLVARLEHPTLGLGLTVVPGSLLRHLFWRDLEVGDGAWDRAHQVSAREPAQARPFLAAVVPALAESRELGLLVRWDDDALVYERPVTTLREQDVMPVIARLEFLATTIASARDAIAPPADVAIELPAWRELAAWLDGDLAVGELSITGTLGGAAIAVAVEREDGRPVRVRASAGDPATASDAVKAVTLRLPQPLADVLAATVPERVVDCVARWSTDLVDLEVEHGVASAALRLAPAEKVAIDAARVRELVLSVRALLAALGPDEPPYR